MRRPLIVGAQKLYLGLDQAIEFARRLVEETRDKSYPFDIAICPSHIKLALVAQVLAGSKIGLGAQNVHQEENGPFTGQVAISELLELGVHYIIVGHSEARGEFSESSEDVHKKLQICLKRREKTVTPIVCVGETKQERIDGKSKEVIEKDIRIIFNNIRRDEFDVENVVIAYEPVWAIKGGKDDKLTEPASPEVANEMHFFIRQLLSKIYGHKIGEQVRILYGGSVNAANTQPYLRQPEIDGLLVGSASIKIESFLQILDKGAERMSEPQSTEARKELVVSN